MSSMPLIVGVVLTLNEERDLARCLDSLSWCDQLIVIDSGSTDSTKAIAHSYNARFFTHVQIGPFQITEQRNWAIEHCCTEFQWVLFLDADEEVGTDLRDYIQSHILHQHSCDAFYLAPRFWFLGKWLRHTQHYPNWHPRLLRPGSRSFTGGVWETFSSDESVGYIPIPYEHYAFSKGLDDWILRHLRYADHDAHELYRFRKNYLTTVFKSNRNRKLRALLAYFWPLRPVLRFLHKFVFGLGFLDGSRSFLYSLLMAIYEVFVIVKYLEISRHDKSQPL